MYIVNNGIGFKIGWKPFQYEPHAIANQVANQGNPQVPDDGLHVVGLPPMMPEKC
jgi:hypothetical protein